MGSTAKMVDYVQDYVDADLDHAVGSQRELELIFLDGMYEFPIVTRQICNRTNPWDKNCSGQKLRDIIRVDPEPETPRILRERDAKIQEDRRRAAEASESRRLRLQRHSDE